jgi:hypothetical protein
LSPLAVGLVCAASGVVLGWLVSALRERPRLRFSMWAKIEPPNVHPRPQLAFRLLNTGRAPIHVERIEGDNGFSLADYFDAVTINVDPEPYEDDVCAPYVGFLEKRPTRIVAVDSMGRKWPLRSRDLKRIYRVLEDHEKASQGAATTAQLTTMGTRQT